MTAEIETRSAPVACPSSTEIHIDFRFGVGTDPEWTFQNLGYQPNPDSFPLVQMKSDEDGILVAVRVPEECSPSFLLNDRAGR